jgi:hypothetical protein
VGVGVILGVVIAMYLQGSLGRSVDFSYDLKNGFGIWSDAQDIFAELGFFLKSARKL